MIKYRPTLIIEKIDIKSTITHQKYENICNPLQEKLQISKIKYLDLVDVTTVPLIYPISSLWRGPYPKPCLALLILTLKKRQNKRH